MSAMKHLDLIAREVGSEDCKRGIRPTSDSAIMRYIMDVAGFPREWDIDLFDNVIDAYCEAYRETQDTDPTTW